MTNDTIFALATPPGKSGVAILRLSGPHARQALMGLSGLERPVARYANYVMLRAPDGGVIDHALAIYFEGPASFTGEDVVELHTHGSLAVIRELLELLGKLPGLRPAEPGEFTRRAFANGKMDLMEAEGLADLIDAHTPRQKDQALRQMQGELSIWYEQLRTAIIKTLAHLEAYIDFPDEEIPESVLAGIAGDIAGVETLIASALADHQRGERIREGIRIVILGTPNAGKSSLLNLLAGRDAAIVSHRAGTTRDIIEVHLDIAGFPVILTDTAGLRDSDDDIEAEGIRRARQRAGEADIKLVLFDGGTWPAQDEDSRQLLDDSAIAVISKSDLISKGERPGKYIFISTVSGEGTAALIKALEGKITAFFGSNSAPFITRNRHRALLSAASAHLKRALLPEMLELKCEELRRAAHEIGKITGKIDVDDVLDVVFKSFCIGK